MPGRSSTSSSSRCDGGRNGHGGVRLRTDREGSVGSHHRGTESTEHSEITGVAPSPAGIVRIRRAGFNPPRPSLQYMSACAASKLAPADRTGSAIFLRCVLGASVVIGRRVTARLVRYGRSPGLRARKVAPTVRADVATPVNATSSGSANPTVASADRRSRTGIAPPIHCDQASMEHAAASASPCSTMSANWRRPPGRRTRRSSRKLTALWGVRLSTPLEMTTSNMAAS